MTSKTITVNAPAKINLYLEVCDKRADGYHDIKSIMQTVSLFDIVTVTVDDFCSDIKLNCNNANVPCDYRNTAYKAVDYFRNEINGTFGAEITIEKKIPTESGLAGGSADAAAVLKALNTLFNFPLTTNALLEIAQKIGADVPFCYIQGCALCEGIGEIITPIENNIDCYYLILRSGEGVSTREAYSLIDSNREKVSPELLQSNINAIKDGIVNNLEPFNSFEKAVLPCHSSAKYLKEKLMEFDAIFSMMSGSGPAVFGVFDDEKSAKCAAEYFADKNILSYLCKNI